MNSELHEINGDLNQEINTSTDEHAEFKNPNIISSQEKILTLKRGYKVWRTIAIISSISFVGFVISMIFVVGKENIYFLILLVPSSLGIVGVFFFLVFCSCCSFTTVNPNEAYIFQYFGKYIGTLKENGYFYGYPLASKTKISLRSNQFNGTRLKVNDGDGNPVELGIIVVWRIGDTAKAVFDVIKYEEFVKTQSEAAIRFIGCKYPYEPSSPGQISLRGGQEIINKELRHELEKRVKVSGIIIEDARVTEISYGDEVAKMMLQKQASNATVFAKEAIVKGATNSILNSLHEFEKYGIKFKDEDKEKYIYEMMRTLCMSSEISKIIGN